MADKLYLIASMSSLTAAIYFLAMRTTPGRGIMRMIERVCMGAALCWLCHTLLSPLGFEIAQSPLAALSAGYLGLPGVALAAVIAHWP
ncbi:MAG: pro-sigmaK processing inhibitor BofA family protein [Clostridia bacterium]|nr:pro-sigmaK processing inhibitor BofA family protein [Clostridia bacterium]